jgi:RHS repeat-associated protein
MSTGKEQDQKDTGYSKNNAPSISLPKGGGAMKGIDEKFSVNAVNGTSGMTIPIPSLKTRSDFAPGLAISYSSGSGNSEFGLGWSLSLPSIQRKTDKRLPQYNDVEESDVFLFAGAEDLVLYVPPVSAPQEVNPLILPNYTITRYQPRVEGLFARIEKIQKVGQTHFYWKVTTRDNLTTYFGLYASSRIADPKNIDRVFKWLPDISFDDKGNYHVFKYKVENKDNIPKHLHEINRLNGIQDFTNVYLKKVRYGNLNPYYVTDADIYFPILPREEFFYTTVFDYGEHDQLYPLTSENNLQKWACRKDPFSDYHAGFEIRTYRLCKRVLCFSHFDELTGIADLAGEQLIQSVNLTYKFEASTQELLETDYITQATYWSYRKNTGEQTYLSKHLPPMKFTYNDANWDTTVHSISTENLANAPVGLSSGYQWVDYYGEGISGILTEQAEGWFYKSNLGKGTFSPAQKIAPKPNTSLSLGGFQNLDGDAKRYLVSNSPGMEGFFELDDDDQWQNFRTFKNNVNIDFNDPFTRMLDLNGDGIPDILISKEQVFTYYESKGTDGYSAAKTSPHPLDENKGPAIVFADSTSSIYLADMSGDGMTDIVRIRNKDICYWPNLGYGKFGAKVTMSNAPLFDHPEQFNPSYIHLSDVSGTGASDIIYLGKQQFKAWLNLSGNAWSEATEITPFPHTELPNTLSVVDLLGNGTSCIVWSSPLPAYTSSPMKYIDLMGGKKPYLMVGYDNSAGKITTLTYKSSTEFYLEDKKHGNTWVTKLPFPVHCVKRVKVSDVVTGNSYSSFYSYHHGYYDHAEREFRGFGRVETVDSESFTNPNVFGYLDEPPILTKSWYHTGAWFQDQKILNGYKHEYFKPANVGSSFQEMDMVQEPLPTSWTAIEQREAFRALKGVALRQEVYALDGSDKESIPYSTTENNYEIKQLQAKGNNRFAIYLVHEKESIAYHYERNANDPRIAHSLNLEIDEYANILKSASVVYPRVSNPGGLPSIVEDEQNKTHIIFSENNFTNDLMGVPHYYRLRIPYQAKQFELTGCTPSSDYFGVDELLNFINQAPPPPPIPNPEIDYVDEADNISVQKRCIEAQFTTFYNDETTAEISLGIIDSKAIPYQTYRLAFTEDLLSNVYGTKVDPNIMLVNEGNYFINTYTINGVDKNYYWIPSGTVSYIQDGFDTPNAPTTIIAKNNFYLPLIATDPFGHKTYLQYYSKYHLLLQSTKDALDNVSTIEEYEWRTLQPQKSLDINLNRTVVAYDILGMPVGVAVLGKGNYDFATNTTTITTEADTLQNFNANLSPTETNNFFANPLGLAKDLLHQATARYIYDYESLPLRVATITREIHANEPVESPLQLAFEYSDGFGRLLMKKVQAEPELSPNGGVGGGLRWVGSGRTILNNKSKPIKQYEPYFSNTHECETDVDIIQVGYSPVIYYDPLGRAIRTDMPDGTFSYVVFDAWMQTSYDANDNVSGSDWFNFMQSGGGFNAQTETEQYDAAIDAAAKSLAHANTPTVVHTDSLARPFYTLQMPDPNTWYESHVLLDIEGNTKMVQDANGNAQLRYKHDMLGNVVYQNSIDGGERWMLNDVFGKPIYGWDSMNQIAHNSYDVLHRPLEGHIDNRLISRIEYGEAPNAEQQNFRGQAIRTWDSAGKHELISINFKGQPTKSSLQLIADATITDIDWSLNPVLDTETFNTLIEYDALGRPTMQIDPGNNKTRNKYGEGGLLKMVELKKATSTIFVPYVTNIIHNAKGQREHIYYGNETKTKYEYNPKNYRVTRILTTKDLGATILQDLRYTYDAVGNITTIWNYALEPVFFNNQQIEPTQTFTYDALYRLIEATGREMFNGQDDDSQDQAFTPFSVNFGNANPNVLTKYTQQYDYDAVGNIIKLRHNAGSNSYTRNYDYTTGTNRLDKTTVNTTQSYSYDAHGNLKTLDSLTNINWNALDQLSYIVKTNTLEAHYQYSGGNRIRKTITKQNGEIEQRIYLGSYELYRKFDASSSLILERSTVHVADDTGRIAMHERLLQGNDGSIPELTRYIYSNHLQSSTLELDHLGFVISYEEYHPYGTTSYHAKSDTINAVAKRYRFTGKERDEESGLYYHGARYYIPWLCRWIAVDPLESKRAGLSSYDYCSNNPIMRHDPDGKKDKKAKPEKIVEKKAETKPAPKQTPTPSWLYSNTPQLKDGQLVNSDRKLRQTQIDDKNKAEIAKYQAWLKYYENQEILVADIYGVGHIGKRKYVEARVANIKEEYNKRLGEAVASGPIASGMYQLKGDRGAFQGEAIQNIGMSFSGVGTPSGKVEKPIEAKFEQTNSLALPKTSVSKFETKTKGIQYTATPLKIQEPNFSAKTLDAKSLNSLISTEPDAQPQEKITEIQNIIMKGNPIEIMYLNQEPIYITNYNGKSYTLDGHNRIIAFSQLNKSLSVTELSNSKAWEMFKTKMEQISIGMFK